MNTVRARGWARGINEFVDAQVIETGWSSGIANNVVPGQKRHEVGVYENGKLIRLFRTDIEEHRGINRSEAERYAQRLQSEQKEGSEKVYTIA